MRHAVHGARNLVVLADVLAACVTERRLIYSDRFVGPAFAVSHAGRANEPLSARCGRMCAVTVHRTHGPAAHGAGADTIGAGAMPGLAARALVGIAIRPLAREADFPMLGTNRRAIDRTGGESVIGAKGLRTDGAVQTTLGSDHVPGSTDGHGGRCSPAARTADLPNARTGQVSLRNQLTRSSGRRGELPARALDDYAALFHLHRLDIDADLVTALLFGTRPG